MNLQSFLRPILAFLQPILAFLQPILGLAAWAAILTASSMAAEPLAVGKLTLDREGGYFTTEVMVNGEGPYDFLVDTGATLSLAFENLSRRQSFSATERPNKRILGLAGVSDLPAIALGHIAIGDVALNEHVGVVAPDWAPPRRTPQGVLGLDFLEDYYVVFDVENRRLEFYDPKDPPRSKVRRWRSVRLKRDSFGAGGGYLLTIDARINRFRMPFIFDLGASGTFINRAALDAISSERVVRRVRSSSGFIQRSELVTDLFDETEAAIPVRAQRLGAGGISWYQPIVLIYDAPIFVELGVNDKPFGLFGADLLRRRRFAIDFSRNRLFVERE